MWHVLQNVRRSEFGELRAGVVVPADSFWFSGHFPDEPVLPAIAQLAMVRDLIQATAETPGTIYGFSRVKFKKRIQPGDPLELLATLKQGQSDSYRFRIETGRETVCSGTVIFGKEPHPVTRELSAD